MTLARRSFITGLISLVAAPAIVRAGNLMPVKVMPQSLLSLWPSSPVMLGVWTEHEIAVMLRRRAYSSEPRRAFAANRIADAATK